MDEIILTLRADKTPPASEPQGGELSSAELDANFTRLKTACEQLESEMAESLGDIEALLASI